MSQKEKQTMSMQSFVGLCMDKEFALTFTYLQCALDIAQNRCYNHIYPTMAVHT